MTVRSCTEGTKLHAEKSIFWRFKGEQKWKHGWVRWVKGRLAEINTIFDATVVAIDEIDWEPND